jgi:hypothetical protein
MTHLFETLGKFMPVYKTFLPLPEHVRLKPSYKDSLHNNTAKLDGLLGALFIEGLTGNGNSVRFSAGWRVRVTLACSNDFKDSDQLLLNKGLHPKIREKAHQATKSSPRLVVERCCQEDEKQDGKGGCVRGL